MSKKFTWVRFPEKFINAVLRSSNTPDWCKPPFNTDDKDYLIPFIEGVSPYPDNIFVNKYRREIENSFLSGSESIIRICNRLKSMNVSGISVSDDEDEMLNSLSLMPMTESLCRCYLDELQNYGNDETSFRSVFVNPIEIDLHSSGGNDSGLYDYQEEAVKKLEKHFITDDNNEGILMMPTGSGKTRTSVNFLLSKMISRGYQVVWLAHRSMLLEQASENFYRLSPLIRENAHEKDVFRMVCVSGDHARAQAMTRNDDVIVGSVQSFYRNPEYLPAVIGEKVIIVVDEAHHAIAPSYRSVIENVKDSGSEVKLLGLTATPVRQSDKGTRALLRMFGGEESIISVVTMSDLIANGTLAKPLYIPRETNLDIETIITLDEEKYINKWKEMPESLLAKVAKSSERNSLIVNEYMDHRDEYGKTLIFALNGIHCVTLNDKFRERGVKSEYVYTTNRNNHEIIERFRSSKSDSPDRIDVLININMLTEGSDIPDIQTVFLTRPTGSDTLLMQMVGRGMRGAACQGGTESVNIVDFCDKWSSITRWMNPKAFVSDDDIQEELPEINDSKSDMILIPVEMIRDLMSGISYRNARISGGDAVLPVGWYDVVDDDGNDGKVLVFENQLQGYSEFKSILEEYNGIEGDEITEGYIMDVCFGGFGILPNEEDIKSIISMFGRNRVFPEYSSFNEREEIDPYQIALKFIEGEITLRDRDTFFKEFFRKHKKIIESIYGGQENYRKRVSDYMFLPGGIVPLGTSIVETEKIVYSLSGDPLSTTIEELLDDIIDEQREQLAKPFKKPEIRWTDRNYSSYFGIYYFDRNEIRINSILNSKDVPEEVVKFIIYHECLHQEFPKHDREFRRRERMYPNFHDCENFLDYKLKDYDKEYAM